MPKYKLLKDLPWAKAGEASRRIKECLDAYQKELMENGYAD